MQLQPNVLLQGGKYRIEKVLGKGGFGITYLAVQQQLDRRVAIKEFFMEMYCDRDEGSSQVSVPSQGSRKLVNRYREKFIKEAQTIAKMKSDHIISIHDIFEENGTAYYVMEYLEGGSLKDLVEKNGPLSEEMALQFIRQVGEALHYIHERNILHLDVKPANILLDEGKAVLIDFGISKRYDEEGGQTSSTPVGISKGYAPIEQYQADGVSEFKPCTDIYSLAATLYFLLTGEQPPIASKVSEDGLPPLPAFISHKRVLAIKKTMEVRRKERPQSIPAFLALLETQPWEETLPPDNKFDGEKTKVIEPPTVYGPPPPFEKPGGNNGGGSQPGGKKLKDPPGKKKRFWTAFADEFAQRNMFTNIMMLLALIGSGSVALGFTLFSFLSPKTIIVSIPSWYAFTGIFLLFIRKKAGLWMIAQLLAVIFSGYAVLQEDGESAILFFAICIFLWFLFFLCLLFKKNKVSAWKRMETGKGFCNVWLHTLITIILSAIFAIVAYANF